MIRNHFTATGVVFNDNNDILMINHAKLNAWLPPGGHIDANELPGDAVLREIYEETGVRARVLPNTRGLGLPGMELDLPFTIILEDIEGDGTHNHIDMIYLCSAETSDVTSQPSEVSDAGWFTHEQVKRLKTFDNVLKTIERAVEYIKTNADNGDGV